MDRYKSHGKETDFLVDVWGRTYAFEKNLFPTSIVSQGQELLAGPIELKMDFGYGEDVPYNCQYRILEAAEDKVVVASAALCGNIILNVIVTLEYDGFIKFALWLIPPAVSKWGHLQIFDWKGSWATGTEALLKSARLSIPVKTEKCSLIHAAVR